MEAIIVALISTVGVVLAALIQHNRKLEKNEHGTVMKTLERVETKIDGHITDHATGAVQQTTTIARKKRSGSKLGNAG